jgi:hypothetical protein
MGAWVTHNPYAELTAFAARLVSMGEIDRYSNFVRLRPAIVAWAACAMIAVMALASFGNAAADAGGATPLDAELEVKHYDFESGVNPSVWTVSDQNGSYGTDQWAASASRAAGGNGSAWVAGSGARDNITIDFVDTSWENGWGDWQVRTDGISTTANWDISDNRAYTGSSSMYCAGSLGGSSYLDRMNAWLYIDLPSGFSNGVMTYKFYADTEYGWDYWYEAWYDGSWHTTNTRNGYYPWQSGSFNIPSGATKVGWYFYTDSSVTYEGVYIDDVKITGIGSQDNTVSRLYDDGMDAWMTSSIDVSLFAGARMDYSYWVDSEVGDYLEVVYYATQWYHADPHEGDSGGWRTSTLTLPTTTTRIGFRFVSDEGGRAEGAYVDEVHVVGTVLSPTCGAQLSATAGVEKDTLFYFDGSGGGGYGTFTWGWTFGDGTNSSFRSPSHVYQDPGTYSPRMTLTDQLGQVCVYNAPEITVTYDLTEVVVAPVSSELIEGTAREFNAETRWGHQLDFDWSVDPANCGVFSVNPAPRSTFTANQDQGGYQCTIIATYGAGSGAVSLNILHDLSEVVVTPPSASVFATQRVTLSATDKYGHPFHVEWWATCGRVLPDQGESTTFTATGNPGSTCIVTAEWAGVRTTVPIAILQDPTGFTVSPATTSLPEGAGVTLSALDRFSKPITVEWAVTPASCGELTLTLGPSTSLITSQDAAPVQCRVTATVTGVTANATVIVGHDLSSGTITLSETTIQAGDSVTASATDRYGHPLQFDWSVSPGTCGELDPVTGPSTTLTTDSSLGQVVCTLTATYTGTSTLVLRGLVSIELGPPHSIEVTFLGAAPEGGQTEARATVKDAGGHALDSSGVSWTTTCDGLSRTTGATTLVTAPQSAAGTTCDVTASLGGITGTGHLQVTRGPAARVEISPSTINVGNGGRVEVSVKAWDQFDHEVVPTTVIWAASCGRFEGEGPTVTYIAPDSGGPCQITATVPGGTVGVSAAASVSTGGGLLLPLAVVVAVAVVAVLGLMMVRRGKGGSKGADTPPPPPP